MYKLLVISSLAECEPSLNMFNETPEELFSKAEAEGGMYEAAEGLVVYNYTTKDIDAAFIEFVNDLLAERVYTKIFQL